MKRIYKRVLAIALALFMVVTLLPGTSLTAQAEGNSGTDQIATVAETGTATFMIGNTTYTDLGSAISAASSGTTIVLASSGTITGQYEIPAGVTLLIPFDSANTCYTTEPACVGNTADRNRCAYRTLTMEAGSSLTVNGAISVSAKHSAAAGSMTYGGTPSGPYGYIYMKDGSNITVNNGGNLYAWGYVSGNGSVTAKSGANVYEYIQLTEFRGGNALMNWEADHEVFPFSQYYVQNIEVPLTLEYGAAENVYSSVHAASMTKGTLFSFINASGGMFETSQGTTVVKRYDPATDRLILDVDGDVALNGMKLEVKILGDLYKISIDSKDFVLPINSNITININGSGSTITLNQDVALLPGSVVNLGQGTTLNVTSGCNLYVYDRDEWIGKGFVHANTDLVPLEYTPTRTYKRTASDLNDAKLNVNGTVNVNGYLYTTAGGANITSSSGTGKIVFAAGEGKETTTNQVIQTSDVTPVAITITNAKLCNANGSYTVTKGNVSAGDTYYWNVPAERWAKTGEYSIIFDSNGGSEIESMILAAGSSVATADPTKEGHTFLGWYDSNGNKLPSTMPAYDVSVTAKWQVNQYTISFNTDGGNAIADIKQDYGTSVTIPTPTKEGYTFVGWDVEAPATMPAKDMTLTAKWEINKYTITFDTDGGSAIDAITAEYGTAIAKPSDPSKEGYTFAGWDKEIPSSMPGENVTIKAVWEINQYTITFNTAGGNDIADITQDYGTAITKPEDPVKEGYTFAGWDVEVPSTMPAGNLTITAKWKVNEYTITFDTDGGSDIPSITQAYGTAITKPQYPTKTGHEFAGWDKEIPSTMPAENMTIKANWNILKYTITFELDGGSGATAITANYGAAITAPSDPTKEGYTFAGWDKEIPSTMPAGDMTITAKWVVNEEAIVFVDTDGETIEKITGAYGTAVTPPADPEKEGYTFAGWDKEIPETIPAETVVITAKWIVNQYKLTIVTDDNTSSFAYYDYGTAIPEIADPVKEGHTFAGWDVEVPSTMPAKDMTITAQWDVNTYTITWLNEDGTELKEETADYGTALIAPTAPLIDGYVFVGWTPKIQTVTSDATYTATYTEKKENQYVVTFVSEDTDVNGDAVYSTLEVKVYSVNEEVALPSEPTKEGYTFVGWYDANGDEVTSSFVMTAQNMTITAKWKVNSYTVSFDPAGGDPVESITQNYGTEVTVPTLERTGYTFEGWIDEDGNSVGRSLSMPAKDVKLTALWSIKSYKISFYTEDGTYAVIKQNYGTEIPEIADPTKIGHTFAGWDTEIPETMPAKNMIIQPKWQVNQYTITFVDTDGTILDSITADYGAYVDPIEDPVKEGYTFAGWNTEIPETMPADNIYIIAKWTANDITITFDTDGGSTVPSITQPCGSDVVAPAPPSKTGYTFAGWDVEVPSTMPTSDMTITAKWTINKYTVSFNTDGGSEVEAVTQDYGTAVEAPTAPTKEGYTFAGWVDDEGKEVTFPLTLAAANVTVKAQWTVNQYTITFNTAGGSDIPAIKQDYGTAVTAPQNPTKEGYTFAGWDAEVPKTMPAKDVTLTAKWTINQYTITFDTDGGTAVAPIKQDYGTAVTAPAAPTKVGYTFAGWDVEVPKTMPAENVTLKAQWSINQYTITFDTDGGTAIAPIKQNYGTAVTAPAAPTKEHYTFAGWDAAIPTTMPAENVTVKALWTVNAYDIGWDTDGDGKVDDTTSVNYGDTPTHADGVKEKTAEYTYVFNGWTPALTSVTGNATYTATFTSVPNTYKVYFDTTGGSTMTALDVKYGDNAKEPVNSPTKAGYTFVGWEDADGNTVTFPFKMPAKDVTVKAVWKLNEYVISWDTDGDGGVDKTTLVNHGVVPTPVDAKKEATAEYTYTFTGWSPAVTAATKDVKYTAQFSRTANVYTIKFVDTDGKVLSSEKVAYGGNVTTPKDPTKTGYTFTGWNAVIPTTMPAKDVTITARWEANTYEIYWDMDGDGKIDDTTYETYGTTPEHDYIQKEADKDYTYNFLGWDVNGDGKVDGIKTVTGSVTYTAVFDAIEIPREEGVLRLFGNNRYFTSFAIAEQLKEELGVSKFSAVIVANGENFPDALAGSYLAAKKNAPILMVDTTKAYNITWLQTYIKANVEPGGTVYILGGTAAISDKLDAGLKGFDIERLAGDNRYQTNIKILEEAGVDDEEILVCTALDFADSLSGSATGLPILLVNPDTNTLTAEQKTFLKSVKGNDICIVGGENAVGAAYEKALKVYDTDDVERLAGATRYETSKLVAERYFDEPEVAVIAYARNFPDGLCGGPLAYVMDAPLILTGPTMVKGKPSEDEVKTTKVAADYVKSNDIRAGVVLGGTAALTDKSVRLVFALSAKDVIEVKEYEIK